MINLQKQILEKIRHCDNSSIIKHDKILHGGFTSADTIHSNDTNFSNINNNELQKSYSSNNSPEKKCNTFEQ